MSRGGAGAPQDEYESDGFEAATRELAEIERINIRVRGADPRCENGVVRVDRDARGHLLTQCAFSLVYLCVGCVDMTVVDGWAGGGCRTSCPPARSLRDLDSLFQAGHERHVS